MMGIANEKLGEASFTERLNQNVQEKAAQDKAEEMQAQQARASKPSMAEMAQQQSQAGADDKRGQTIGCSYGQFDNFSLYFQQSPTGSVTFAAGGFGQGLLEIDWTATYSALKPQQITIQSIDFEGTGGAANSEIGLRVAKSGGNAQGDTVNVKNCLANGLQFGYMTGSPGGGPNANYSYNALSLNLDGGDVQGANVGVGVRVV